MIWLILGAGIAGCPGPRATEHEEHPVAITSSTPPAAGASPEASSARPPAEPSEQPVRPAGSPMMDPQRIAAPPALVDGVPPWLPPDRAERLGALLASGPSPTCGWLVIVRHEGEPYRYYTGDFVSVLVDDRAVYESYPVILTISFANAGAIGTTLSFGEDGWPPGKVGWAVLGQQVDDDHELHVALHEGRVGENTWSNTMTGERRAFAVNIVKNNPDTVFGEFVGRLLNVPKRQQLTAPEFDTTEALNLKGEAAMGFVRDLANRKPGVVPEVNHGDIDVWGSFVWLRGKCRFTKGSH
jgi:hypothetical protein